MSNIDRRALIKSGAAGLAAATAIATSGGVVGAAGTQVRQGGGAARRRRSFELIVVRHAEAERNPRLPDEAFTFPLTLLGLDQAEQLARQFRRHDVSGLVSSTRLRTVQTADAIALSQGVQLRMEPAFLEISLAGISSVAEAEAVFAEWAAGNLDAKTPAGESAAEARARALPRFQALVEEYRGVPGKLVVVCHGATMFAVLPGLFTNVTMPFAVANQPGNTGVIRGEFVDDQLVCTDWLGLDPA